MTNLDSTLKSGDISNRSPSSQGYGFSSSHVWMWESHYKGSWVPKNWCFWTVVLEKTLEKPLDCKVIQPVHPKGNQSWIFNGRTDVEAETNTLATWCGELKSEGRRRRDDRGWDGWMASPTQWTWVWVNSASWWWTGRPGVLQSMGPQSQTQLSNWTELNLIVYLLNPIRDKIRLHFNTVTEDNFFNVFLV